MKKSKKAVARKKAAAMTAKRKVASKKAVAKVAKAVAKKDAKSPPEEKPIEGTPVQRQDAARRSYACNAAINSVLQQYRCRLVPIIMPPEPIGTEPVGKIIVTQGHV